MPKSKLFWLFAPITLPWYLIYLAVKLLIKLTRTEVPPP